MTKREGTTPFVRGIDVLDFREVTEKGEDGVSGLLHFRKNPPGSEHRFRVLLSRSVGSPLGVSFPVSDEDRPRVLEAMLHGAQERLTRDPRRELLAEEELQLEKEDVKPFL